MADSGLSASELRQRYHRGGSATDDELSSSQLRARHGIPSNKGNFSTGDGKGKKGIDTSMIIGCIIGVVIVVVIVYQMSKS